MEFCALSLEDSARDAFPILSLCPCRFTMIEDRPKVDTMWLWRRRKLQGFIRSLMFLLKLCDQ